MTPEGRVKASINRVLSRHKSVYSFMSVPGGYGPSTIDYLLCVRGVFIGIEAKRPDKQPTPRQDIIIAKIKAAGGIVFVIDGPETLKPLINYLAENT